MIASNIAEENQQGFFIDVGEPLDALCSNFSRSRVVVTGKTVTKIFSVGDHGFELCTDRGKPKKSFYFSGSLAWSPLKAERMLKAHRTVATKVCFNEFDENLLVSGSKDSTVWLYDLRAADPLICFAGNSDDPIRDIQFCMESKDKDIFVTSGDSGTVRFWDIRRPDKIIKEFIAHSSQVYNVALNPFAQSKNLIATAGRDKFVRIWNWSKQTPDFKYSVEMQSAVTRVSWCSDSVWHIACCFSAAGGFVSNDNAVFIWDIRRPYLPFAVFETHTKTCTDISWSRSKPNDRFLTCGKDGLLVMNFVGPARRPICYANSVAISYDSPFDGIVASIPSDRRKGSSDFLDPFRRKIPSVLFCVLPLEPLVMTARILAYFATNYKLIGESLAEICEHNAKVAEAIGKSHYAYSWRMLLLLCQNTELSSIRPQFFAAKSYTGKGTPTGRKSSSRQASGEMKRHDAQNHSDAASVRSSCALRKRNSIDSQLVQELQQLNGCFPGTLLSGSLNMQQRGDDRSQISSAFGGIDLLMDEHDLDGLLGIETRFSNQGNKNKDGIRRRSKKISSNRSTNTSTAFDEIILREHLCSPSSADFDVLDETARKGSPPLDLFSIKEDALLFRMQNSDKFTRCLRHQRRRQKTGTGNSFSLDFHVPVTQIHSAISNLSNSEFEEGSNERIKPVQQCKRDYISCNISHCDAENDGNLRNIDSDGGMPIDDSQRNQFHRTSFYSPATSSSDSLSTSATVSDEEEEHYDEESGTSPASLASADEIEIDCAAANVSSRLWFDPVPRIKAMLEYYSNLGDIQMCASVCMAIGERLIEPVDIGKCPVIRPNQVELWFYQYLELLERLRTWKTAALLVKTCFRPKISQLSKEGTFVKIMCKYCRSTSLKPSLRCNSCRKPYDYICSICDLPVRGIWTECSDCGHGGHTNHLMEWFGQSKVCPYLGCRHHCLIGQHR